MENALAREVILIGHEQQSQELADHELVELARSGDHEAFGSLVRKYRAQAMDWVNVLTTDSYMAEDIVQDALIRAFLHLGTLMDTRFAKERPFSNFI